MAGASTLPTIDVACHIVDVHCHPTDSLIRPEALAEIPIRICAMATGNHDQHLVAQLAQSSPQVVPCFGHHPWFSHFISLQAGTTKEQHYRALFLATSDPPETHVQAFERLLPLLPDPTPLSDVISALRDNLLSFPSAMLGEVGIDKSFRVPYSYFDSPRELTPFIVPFDHQLAVLEHQLDLAVSLQRNISLHSVKCPSQTLQLLNNMKMKHQSNWSEVNLDLHSCGLSPEMLIAVQKHHSNVFCSLSAVINGRSDNHKRLMAACRPDRLLAESDIHNLESVFALTWEIIQTIASIKDWPVEEHWQRELPRERWGVVRHLEENWLAFQRRRSSS